MTTDKTAALEKLAFLTAFSVQAMTSGDEEKINSARAGCFKWCVDHGELISNSRTLSDIDRNSYLTKTTDQKAALDMPPRPDIRDDRTCDALFMWALKYYDEIRAALQSPQVQAEPLPREVCETFVEIRIDKRPDGTYGFRCSGMLPDDDIVKAMMQQGYPLQAAPDQGNLPDKWPTYGRELNVWNKDLSKFTSIIERAGPFWLKDWQLKYLSIRIDTRDGAFIILDRDNNRIPADRVLDAIRKWRDFTNAAPQLDEVK